MYKEKVIEICIEELPYFDYNSFHNRVNIILEDLKKSFEKENLVITFDSTDFIEKIQLLFHVIEETKKNITKNID